MNRPVRVWNPPNPYLSEHRELLGEPPPAELEVYIDHSKSVLNRNDSPDLNFRWSVNPYRGCTHACAYCLEGSTPILMADGNTRRLAAIKVGDVVYGTVREGRYRRYVPTRVRAHWSTLKAAYRVLLEDGTKLIASADHRFLSNRGWKYVLGAERGRLRRPHLTTNVELLGTGGFAAAPDVDAQYQRGYLSGLIRGDGLLRTSCYDGRRRARDIQHQLRLALADGEALARARKYLSDFGITTVKHIRELLQWPVALSPSWSKGFLAGIFDAEGSYSRGILRITNTNPEILGRIRSALLLFGFRFSTDVRREGSVCGVRILGGFQEALRFFHTMDPVILRKRNIAGQAIKSGARLRVIDIRPLGIELPMFDITTGTGDFIANGVVSHNCYARRTHEYFGLGAGTDFDTKIFVKPDAPQLLRKALQRKSWRREPIAFSGVTDCYQPLEAVWRLTRQCLEVCLERRNPVGIVTKSLLIRRDRDVLSALHAEAAVSVAISIAFLDEAVVRKLEPGTPTIKRRFETMRLLADAGIPVGIGVAPIIPGLNDQDIPGLLKQAKACGAQFAFHTVLRLPGSVEPVFLQRLQAALPLRRQRIEHRLREVRGGRLNDSRFGHRHAGQGVYWQSVQDLWQVWAKRLGFGVEEKPETTQTTCAVKPREVLHHPPPPREEQLLLY
jgi:DNA repair photolyase